MIVCNDAGKLIFFGYLTGCRMCDAGGRMCDEPKIQVLPNFSSMFCESKIL